MTAAFSMGLPLLSRTMVTSMREVGGGDLYLRPRLLLSWALALDNPTANPTAAMVTAKRKKRRRNMEIILSRGEAHKRLQSGPLSFRVKGKNFPQKKLQRGDMAGPAVLETRRQKRALILVKIIHTG